MVGLREKIASEVKNKRQGLNMSQEELAFAIEKTSSFVGQLERGECSLKVETLQALVRCLGIDANALLLETENGSTKLNELCAIASQLDESKMNLLLGIAKLLQQMGE